MCYKDDWPNHGAICGPGGGELDYKVFCVGKDVVLQSKRLLVDNKRVVPPC